MVSYMDRLIGSAQRQISIPNPQLKALDPCLEMVFHIQGITLLFQDQEMTFLFANMFERGIHQRKCRKMRLMDRLLRRPAPVGRAVEDDAHILHVTFWTEPELELQFDLNPDGQVELWSEAYIMIRSAGFELLRP